MVDGDPISCATYIKKESLRTTSDDFVGPGIWRGERRTMTVGSDEDVGCQGQLAWNVGRPGVSVCLPDRNIFPDNIPKAMDVFMRIGVREEFRWNN